MTYEEFLKFIEKSNRELFTLKDDSVENQKKILEAQFETIRGVKKLYANIFRKADITEFSSILCELMDDKSIESGKSDFFRQIKNSFRSIPELGPVAKEFDEFIKNEEERIPVRNTKAYLQMFGNFIYKNKSDRNISDKMKETLIGVLGKIVSDQYFRDDFSDLKFINFKKSLERLSSSSDVTVNIDECIPDEKEILSPGKLPEIYVDAHPYAEKISSLINNEKLNLTEEEKSALKEADNIIVKGDPDYTALQSSIAEYCGVVSDKKHINAAIENIKEKNPEIQNLLTSSRILLQFVPDLNDENMKKIGKNIEEPSIDENTKNTLKEIGKELDDKDLYDKINFKGEQGRKFYGLMPLIEKQEEIKKALDNNDIKEVSRKVKEYKKLEADFGKIMKKIETISDKDTFVSNISSSREREVPTKYRNDFINVSKLNGIILARGFCTVNGIDFNSYVDNPIGELKKFMHNIVTKESEMQKVMAGISDDPVKMIDFFSGKGNADFKKANENIVNSLKYFVRPVIGMTHLNKDESKRVSFYKNINFFSAAYQSQLVAKVVAGFCKAPDKNTIKNMLVADMKKTNPLMVLSDINEVLDPLTNEPYPAFDRSAALKDASARDLISKIIKIYNNPVSRKDANQIDAVIELAGEIKASGMQLDNNEKALLGFVSESTEIPEVLVSNFEAKNSIADIDKTGVNKDNVGGLINLLAKNKREYNSRNIFAKIFYSGVRKQNENINAITKKLTDCGITAAQINDAVNYINSNINNSEAAPVNLDSIKASMDAKSVKNNGRVSTKQIVLDDKNFREAADPDEYIESAAALEESLEIEDTEVIEADNTGNEKIK